MIWAGLVGLVIAVCCALLARVANARARAMERTETLPVEDLRALHEAAAAAAGAGHFRYRCEVVGQALPHKDGALRSEPENAECVWHKHRITRKYEETYRDGDGDGNRRRRTRTEVVSEHSSRTAFFVADTTGRIVIRPGDEEFIGAEKILDRFDPHTGDGTRLKLGPLSLDLGGGSSALALPRPSPVPPVTASRPRRSAATAVTAPARANPTAGRRSRRCARCTGAPDRPDPRR
ncbi:GIDE domain-containing protein [Streptomyces noursei]|uniref:GIDE domain-containing protein n=1 Tax=Streptomyces noursei TaxID=1971 RepID=UPI0030F04B00